MCADGKGQAVTAKANNQAVGGIDGGGFTQVMLVPFNCFSDSPLLPLLVVVILMTFSQPPRLRF